MSTNRIEAVFQIQTTETDTDKRLAPDGVGGVEWGTGGSGGGSPNLDGGDASSTYGAISPIDGGTA